MLAHARLARGVTVEEAAQATRMRPGLIRALEDSNLTQFPNAAYAKSFLLMYAKYLHIDMKGVAGTIDTSTQMRVEDFQYLTSLATEEKRQQREATSDSRYDFVVARKTSGSWLPLLLVVVAGAIAVVVFVVINNLHRFEAVKTTPAPQPQPAAHPAFKTSPAPSVAPTTPAPGATANAAPPAPAIPEHPGSTAVPAAPGGAHESATATPANVAIVPAPGGSTNTVANVPTPPPVPAVPEPDPRPARDEDNTAPPLPPGTVVLEPVRKTWIVIRTGPGGQPLYEDYLYPTAKAMHLPAGKYFIELRDATGVEISKDGKTIAYAAPGVLVD